MIALMLDDLCGPASKFLNMLLHVQILVFQFNFTKPLCLPGSSKRKAALFRFEWPGLLTNGRILIIPGDQPMR